MIMKDPSVSLHANSIILLLSEIIQRGCRRCEDFLHLIRDFALDTYLRGRTGFIFFGNEEEIGDEFDGYLYYRFKTEQGIKLCRLRFYIENRYRLRKSGLTAYLTQQVRSAALSDGFEVVWVTDKNNALHRLSDNSTDCRIDMKALQRIQFEDLSEV